MGQMFEPVPLLSASGVWLDVRAVADLVSLRDAGVCQWPGVVGAATAASASELSAQRQQVSLDRRLETGSGVVRPAVADVVAEGARRTAASGASGASGARAGAVQLDG